MKLDEMEDIAKALYKINRQLSSISLTLFVMMWVIFITMMLQQCGLSSIASAITRH